MSGGFRPSLVRKGGFGGDVPFLASEHLQVKRGGATFQQGAGDSVDNYTVIQKGTFVVPGTDGYYKVYADGDVVTDDSGFLMESINTSDGDVVEGILLHGSVLAARVLPDPFPAAAKTALAGRITFQ